MFKPCETCLEMRRKIANAIGLGHKWRRPVEINADAAAMDAAMEHTSADAQELFLEFLGDSDGHQAKNVLDACAHMAALAIYHSCPGRESAEKNAEEFAIRLGDLLGQRYDKNGKRKSFIAHNAA